MTDLNIKQLAESVQNLNQRVALLESQKSQTPNGLNMNENAIWTPKHIAKYTGLSVGYVTQHLIKVADFPSSIKRETGTKRQRKLYLAGDIIRYFEQRKTN
ncbi:hypothetical protein [Mannheimia haemolytica]|uniref:hypothetical protein n=1 Tax=Mannheimia haemolytica TaxID=75985 RepID=UPI0001BCF8FB|nr:hypothetical protein [Mannheimia haemolytica]EEY12691.1 hypothetical protein COK_1274 [Mannheimia haemolytica serotype A2 str. BOVINE]MDW0723516.1 hypothetical protein [Mannheimia haemolytica]MDW0736547.1 hypothetical protein [Mannheimia haemolytica]TRC14850.1 hypothetical protein FEA50_05160 [Mannheimia haemolytica]TRC67422.1 hypothetical protein FEA31_05320 [Mannheimia haemolytica]